MNASPHKHDLFTESGCLSQNAIERYLGDLLSQEELKKFNEHIAVCPLCQDAVEGLEGLEQTPDTSFVSEDISMSKSFVGTSQKMAFPDPVVEDVTDRINARLRRRFDYDPFRRRTSRKGPVLGNFLIPAAASVIVLVGIIAYFHYFFPEKNQLALVTQEEQGLVAAEKDMAAETFETSADPDEHESSAIGGIMERTGQPVDSKAGEAAVPVSNQMPDKGVAEVDLVEDDAMAEEELIIAEAEEELAVAKPEALDEAVTIYAAEEKAGAGAPEKSLQAAKSRAAVDQKKGGKEMEYVIVEQAPGYPGGSDSLYSFLGRNLAYPLSKDASGDTTVIAQFTISKKGKARDIVIVKSAGENIDREVIRVLILMPEWTPGMQDGKAVSVKYVLPLHFDLD